MIPRLGIIAATQLFVTFQIALANDLELRDLDVSGWPCLNQPSGTAKTVDGIERNKQKNRPLIPVPANVESLDTAGFLKKVADYDAALKAQKRTELTDDDKNHLSQYENQVISLTGYLGLAYPGPPETCNCADRNFHDFHLEIFSTPIKHHPEPGDKYTPIICETTPRVEQSLYRDGVRLRDLTGFFRDGKQCISTNHPPALIKVTGYLMWDDEHNGRADIGSTIQYVTAGNGFWHPWRSTAWEIHPVIKIERLNSGKPTGPSQTPATRTMPMPTAATIAPSTVVLAQPVSLSTSSGIVTLPAGARLPVVSGTATTLRIQYGNQQFDIPVSATGAAR